MDISAVLKALGEPMRFRIYCCLLERRYCVRALSRKLGITESAVSQHLKVMREADMIYGEKYGHHTHYMPKQETLDELAALFADLQKKSRALERTGAVCRCGYRKEEKE